MLQARSSLLEVQSSLLIGDGHDPAGVAPLTNTGPSALPSTSHSIEPGVSSSNIKDDDIIKQTDAVATLSGSPADPLHESSPPEVLLLHWCRMECIACC